MDVKIKNEKIEIRGTSLKLLKLKSDLTAQLGDLVTLNKDFITIPLSALNSVSDLLPQNIKIDTALNDTLTKLKSHGIARKQALSVLELLIPPSLPETSWSNILDPAQITAVAVMTIENLLGLCLFDEQGIGKTVMTIAAFDILKELNEVNSMIVICPKSMISEWSKDIKRFLPEKYKIVTAIGSKGNKRNSALGKFDVLITNYEGIEAMRIALIALSKNQGFLLVVDESYYVKNSATIRSQYITQLRNECKRCFVLCGTPAPNSAYDLVNQFNLADIGFTFGGFKKSTDPEADKNKIISLIEAKGLFIRRLKSEILDNIPEKKFHVISVELSGKQKLMYENARSELELYIKRLDNETFKKQLATYFQRRAVLLQICCSPDVLDHTLSEPFAKYVVLDELLEKLITQGRKVIIWTYYKRSLDELYARYKQYNPVRIDGSVNIALRQEAVRLFQEDPDTKLFIGNPAAAGAGITLHAAYDAIYFSYSNQAAHYLQSLDRIHRRGQESNEVNYYLLICKGTIEETEVKKLRGKEISQHNLLGDHIKWPSSLDDALLELQAYE